MEPVGLFGAVLGQHASWEVRDVGVDQPVRRIDGLRQGEPLLRPVSIRGYLVRGAEGQAVHEERECCWRQLDFFEHEAYIQAAIPYVRCASCGKMIQVDVQ